MIDSVLLRMISAVESMAFFQFFQKVGGGGGGGRNYYYANFYFYAYVSIAFGFKGGTLALPVEESQSALLHSSNLKQLLPSVAINSTENSRTLVQNSTPLFS